MSASKHMKLALAAFRAFRTRLSTAREYARAVHLDERALQLLQRSADDEQTLVAFAAELELAEARSRTETRRHARAA